MDYRHILETLIQTLINEGGSDIHITTGRFPAIRVSGQLIFLNNSQEFSEETVLGVLTVMVGPEKVKKFMQDKELDFAHSMLDSRLRGNVFFQRGSISMVMRLIPKAQTFKELNLPDVLREFALKKQGLFLVVGPVGQGKSTTMSSMINLINNETTAHIITIEDPIEYVYTPVKSIINQREVGIDTKGFDSALKSAFREDVNVIMVGEMRSPETIAIAVTAAETGHLVISTLHTNNASQTIDRIIDAFPEHQQGQIRIQLASSLIGIFSQRLVPRITGGRVPAYEMLINNNAVANLIREKRTHEIDVVVETGLQQGMVDMNRSLLELVEKGEITMETAMQYSLNPKSMEQLM